MKETYFFQFCLIKFDFLLVLFKMMHLIDLKYSREWFKEREDFCCEQYNQRQKDILKKFIRNHTVPMTFGAKNIKKNSFVSGVLPSPQKSRVSKFSFKN